MFDWSLPGPEKFISDLAEQARARGAVALIIPPHAPEELDAALGAALEATHEHVLTVCAADPRPPVEVLGDALCLSLPSARMLRGLRDALSKAVLIRGRAGVDGARWDATLRAFLSGCAEPGSRFHPIFIVIASPDWRDVLQRMKIDVVEWRGVVSRVDAARTAFGSLGQGKDPVWDRLAVETAISIGGWDLERVAVEATRRIASLDALFDVPKPKSVQGQPSWDAGTLDRFDGRDFASALVATAASLRRRVWLAQVAALFGVVEQKRLEFLESHRSLVRRLPGDPLEYEWGPLARHLRNQPIGQTAAAFRDVRNCLAHGEPITATMYKSISKV